MAEISTNTASKSSLANFATEHAEDDGEAKHTQHAIKETGATIGVLDRDRLADNIEQEGKAQPVVSGINSEQHTSVQDQIEEIGQHEEVGQVKEEKEDSVEEESTRENDRDSEDSEDSEGVREEESGHLEEEEKRDNEEEEVVRVPVPEMGAEEISQEVTEEAEEAEEVEDRGVVEVTSGPLLEDGNANEEAEEVENKGAVEVTSGPLLEDGNANIEIPAIALTRMPRDVGGMRKIEDPFGVQEVLDAPLPEDEDSQYLRINYPTTTARVAAIKKKRYMTLGNILFLVGSAVVVASVLFIYFASLVFVGAPKAGVPTATSVQETQPTDNVAGLPARFAGAETAAPPANGNALAGYQWIHDGTKHVLYVDANNHIQELYSGDQQIWHVTDLTRGAGAAVSNGRALAGFEWQRGSSEQVVYIDAKGHVQQIFASTDDQWNVMDLTRKAQAPLANGRTISGYEWEAVGSKQVVYVDQNNHIQELMSTDGTNWRVSDLTALTKAPLANGNVVVGYDWAQLGSKQVVYIDINQHVQELSFVAGSWHVVDLHSLVGAPLAKGNVLVGYQWQQNGSKQIAYLDTNNHIQLLSSMKQENWSLLDLTQVVKAPATNGNTLVGYEWQQGGLNVLYFIDRNNHIQEISDAPGENWQLVDLNQFVPAASPPNGKIVFGYDWAQRGTKQVVYIDNRNTVQELIGNNVSNKWYLSSWKHN